GRTGPPARTTAPPRAAARADAPRALADRAATPVRARTGLSLMTIVPELPVRLAPGHPLKPM
ncbi:MAG: hypothetical protein ACR2K9_07865, partial [Solirubrobacteraceae bacterium]